MKRIAFLFALAASAAAFAASAPTARFGDLGMNAQVVTNVDFSGLAVEETDPSFNSWTNSGARLSVPLILDSPIIGDYDTSTVITSNGVSGWHFTPMDGSIITGYWQTYSFNWCNVLTNEVDPTVSSWAKATSKPSYSWSEITDKPSFKTVATSGSYNDLTGKPSIPSSAADVGAYSSADGTSLANIVNSWEGYWDGTNVIFEVTNYYGNTSGEIPRLRIKELREGAWQTVWDEANKFQVCETNIMSNVVAYVSGEMGDVKQYAATNFAPIAWGTVTDKGTTNVVGNSVWMTAPETYFAGGTEYQRVAVGSGSICVLTDNGALAKTAGEPGTFRFQDEGGTNYFGFAKSESYTIGCNTDGITVEGTLVTLRYDVIMGGGDVPVVYWRQSLTGGEWVQLNNADGTATQGAPYTVTWYTSGGAYYAAINCGANASGFFKAETSVAGDVVFETNMKMRVDGGIVCTNTATGAMGVIRPTFNGSSVTWNWSAK